VSQIFVQDNFFLKEDHLAICKQMTQIEYTPPDKERLKFHKGSYWHYCPLPPKHNLKLLIRKLIKQYFNVNVDPHWQDSNYTMVGAADRARPHIDECLYQCLIYVMGDEKLNNGTGFYTKEKDGSVQLNTHIGFKQNRAIFFTGGTWHAPLHPFAEEGKSSFRYSITNCFNIID
tara:strand:+ start:225 stop:746 length:522 start_codon:yes stop_codon:yes gene_type:complete